MKIIISGMVGVGKSTISENLYNYFIKNNNRNLKIGFLKELQFENPYLDFFYKERCEWSFLIQIDFLLERYKKLIIEDKKNNDITIFDRHFLDDYIFANSDSIKEDITNIHLNIYLELNKYLSSTISENDRPDYFFLLKAEYNEIINRINKRGRSFEKSSDLNKYWKSMYKVYYENKLVQEYLLRNTKNFIIIDANKSEKEILNEILDILNSKNLWISRLIREKNKNLDFKFLKY
ncbi:MAG: deoxyadenosine kinase [Candidatus Hepatoplasma vulgare]|nr:MAG: deoxyadenosine kinase [Candidatus Hepatoplasma sp.]